MLTTNTNAVREITSILNANPDETGRMVAADRADDADMSDLAENLRNVSRSYTMTAHDPEMSCTFGRNISFKSRSAAPLDLSGIAYLKEMFASLECKKRGVHFNFHPEPKMALTANYNDGGTVSLYYWYNLETGETRRIPGSSPFQATPEVEILPGICLIEMGYYCGKEVAPTIHLRREDGYRFGLIFLPICK